MAKTLNQFLEGYLKVKNPDEQKFVDKHVVAKHADRNGNGDEVFKGSKVKMDDRRKTRHGYNPGEDEKVYEELKGSQHKIDANKNGKVDAHDFKLLRGKKKVAEEVEELEELSTEKLLAYRKKAKAGDIPVRRGVGIDTADEKINKKTGVYNPNLLQRAKAKLRNEEAEELEELSQDKLMQYRSAAKKQGTGIQDKMKIGGGDWSKDGKDTSTLKKRMAGYKMAGRKTNPDLAASVGKAPRVAATEEVQIDEISSGLAQRYLQKKRERDYNTSADGTTHTLKKPTTLNRLNRDIKGTVRALKTIEKAKKTNEEAEQIDELSIDTMKSYGDKRARTAFSGGRKPGQSVDAGIKMKSKQSNSLSLARTKINRVRDTGSTVLNKEEAEQIDETAKIVAHLQKRYGDNIRKSHVVSAANDFGVDASKLAKAVRTKLGKNMLGEKLNMDKASMGDVITDFKDSNAPQFKGKSQDKRRAMAIAAKLTAERGGKPLRKEEKLADLLGDLTETHRRTMLSVFDKLNENNQKKFLEACETPKGVESMLDFSISHRGE
jgi:glutaredoxin 2